MHTPHPCAQRTLLSIALVAAISLTACTPSRTPESAPAKQRAASSSDVGVAEPKVIAQEEVDGFAVADAVAPELEQAEAKTERRQELGRTSGTVAVNAAPATPVLNAPAVPATTQASADAMRDISGENYAERTPNSIKQTASEPVSTFSVDVDTGAYTNVRRMLSDGILPPTDAVRSEEFINYFDFAYQAPREREQPFTVTTELAASPFNAKRELLLVGLQGYELPKAKIPPANLVFLLDVSGSMDTPDKLPLLKQALLGLVENLRAQDKVSIVVYAGAAGMVLEPTPGDQKAKIADALQRLSAGGSTNGGEGLALAYRLAAAEKIPGGVNRVILATDGDFNVGNFDTQSLKAFIAKQRENGIELSSLGFGTGNYNDEMAEQLANVGNGNYSYIDSAKEAERVLGRELSGTLFTIAKDVKIQIEFNPSVISEYRLLGYENRILTREDFNNDRVDAGEIGAGHTVTAVYEITRVGSEAQSVDALRYQIDPAKAATANVGELGFLKLRYKQPGASESTLISQSLKSSMGASARLKLAGAIAGFAEVLQNSDARGKFEYDTALSLLEQAERSGELGPDDRGQRAELRELMQRAKALSDTKNVQVGN